MYTEWMIKISLDGKEKDTKRCVTMKEKSIEIEEIREITKQAKTKQKEQEKFEYKNWIEENKELINSINTRIKSKAEQGDTRLIIKEKELGEGCFEFKKYYKNLGFEVERMAGFDLSPTDKIRIDW